MYSAVPRDRARAHRHRLRSISRSRRAIGGAAVLIASLAIAQPVAAEGVRDRVDRRDSADVIIDRRADRDLEVLSMACRIVDQTTDRVLDTPSNGPTDRLSGENADAVVAPSPSPTRIPIGCRWRPAESRAAVGYQLWRIVDRGERELVARGGLDMVGARDQVSARARVVRYAVLAVDDHGRRVGQSRVVALRLHDDRPNDRLIRLRRHNVG